MAKWKLDVSPKSVIVCSVHGDAVEISRRLRARGFLVRAVRQAPFLGIDQGGGTRHARQSRRKRVAKHAKLHSKIRRYARAAKTFTVTSRLERTSAAAAGNYGHQIFG
eukprot:5817955-Pyramimonas_sp.AAC.1